MDGRRNGFTNWRNVSPDSYSHFSLGVGWSAGSTDIEFGLRSLFCSRSHGLFRPVSLRQLVLILFEESGEPYASIVRNHNAWCRSADAHRGDRSVDFHIACLGNFAGDESKCSFGQAHQTRIRLAVRIVNEFGHNHASIAGQIESSAIGKCNTDLTIGSGREDITEIDWITDFRVAGLVADSRLQHDRVDVLDCDRTYRGNHFSDRFYRGGLDRRLSLNVLCLCGHGKKQPGRQKGTGYEDGDCMRAHRSTLWEGVPNQ